MQLGAGAGGRLSGRTQWCFSLAAVARTIHGEFDYRLRVLLDGKPGDGPQGKTVSPS